MIGVIMMSELWLRGELALYPKYSSRSQPGIPPQFRGFRTAPPILADPVDWQLWQSKALTLAVLACWFL